MNVEMSFVNTDNREALLVQVASRLRAPPDSPGKQPDWGLSSSYDVLLAPERKRKVAVSPVQNGWVALVESKEVIDFAFLQFVGDTFKTDVVAIQVSDVGGAGGHALYRAGIVQEKYFSEDDDDPLANARSCLRKIGIPFDILTFREAIQLRSTGWAIL
ncbi:MAG: hypothetical protein WCP86_11500 [bacterium]|jgi:hypothetical protein